MRKNNKGFTMIELLAAVVVLGILMGIAVPAVMTVLQDQRNQTYIDDSLRLVANAERKMRNDNKVTIPARGDGCVVLTLSYMNNNAFETGPYGGSYDKRASFVVAKRNVKSADEEYTYYVVLVEQLESGSYRGIYLSEANSLYADSAKDTEIKNFGSVIYPDTHGPASLLSALKTIKSTLPCNSISGIYTSS